MDGFHQAERERLAALRTRMQELRDEFRAILGEYEAGHLRLMEEVALLTAVSREASDLLASL